MKPTTGRRSAVILSLVVVVAMAGAAAGEARAPVEGVEPPVVPLGEGHIGLDQWAARLERPEDPQEVESGHICLTVALLLRFSRYRGEESEATECSLPPGKHPFVEVLKEWNHRKPRVAAAVLAGGSATKMFLKLRGYKGEMVPLKAIPVQEGESVNQVPLSAFARGYAHPFCIERLTIYDAGGRRIGSQGQERCNG